MSEQEQFAAVGRMAKERTDARHKIAVLKREIEDRSKAIHALGAALSQSVSSVLEYQTLRSKIEALQAQGGIDALAALVDDLQVLRDREHELTESLRGAGVE